MKIEKKYLKEWVKELGDYTKLMERRQDAVPSSVVFDGELMVRRSERNGNTGGIARKKPGRLLLRRLYDDLVEYAERESIDLLIEEEDTGCCIQMEFNILLLERMQPEKHWYIWRKIVRYADSILLCPVRKYGQSIIRYTVFFDF